MSEPENFLSRWARRKQQVAREEGAPDDAVAGKQKPAEETTPEVQADIGGKDREQGETAESGFDLSRLPSIESISADTDIRPFLAAGVPGSLRQAALRRAWSADPRIRDFIGIAENQWDFTEAGNAPGFDFSPPTGDVQRMVAEIFGERPKPDSEIGDRTAAMEPSVPPRADASLNQIPVNAREVEFPDAREEESVASNTSVRISDGRQLAANDAPDVASQNNDATQNESVKISRRAHGGAMPK